MNQEEREKISKKVEGYVRTTGRTIREVIRPQIEGFKKDYNDCLKELRTTSGVIAGAVTALLSSSMAKVEGLAITAPLVCRY